MRVLSKGPLGGLCLIVGPCVGIRLFSLTAGRRALQQPLDGQHLSNKCRFGAHPYSGNCHEYRYCIGAHPRPLRPIRTAA